MVAPAVELTIDRSGLTGAPAPLMFRGVVSTATWTLMNLRVPGRVRRNTYAPDADNIHGSEVYASAWQQGLISFSARPEVADEAALQTAVSDLYAALDQRNYVVKVKIGTGMSEQWTCDPGSAEPGSEGRTYVDLRDASPIYLVTIPCYPIASLVTP